MTIFQCFKDNESLRRFNFLEQNPSGRQASKLQFDLFTITVAPQVESSFHKEKGKNETKKKNCVFFKNKILLCAS